ncbi:Crotonobetainyl-CoA:carnitine CoA-transferase CaiB-like acyl-CoA transferase OS=Castellaniella defragrans OX=75697 GN=HNR28_003406 PE=3 SV=1 [Castellaniella defragrans]
MPRPLKGFRVVEMGTYITGPSAAMHLADLGADVIKVEQPGTGDPFRVFNGELYSPHYQAYNRNKRSIALDIRNKEQRELFHELIGRADVFIQNFRPGVADRLGCGSERLQALNPKLVYCAISGFGQTGPYRDRPAFDTVAQAASGFLRLVTPPDHPRVIGPAIADAVTGQYAALGVMAALLERLTTGRGRIVEVSMLEAMAHFNIDSFTHFFSEGEIMGPLSRPQVSQSYTFLCADGGWIAIHMSSPEKFWVGLTETVGKPELRTDPRFSDRPARIRHQDDLISILTPLFAARSRSQWCDDLAVHGVPHSAAYDADEALDDPQAVHLNIAVTAQHPVRGAFRSVRAPYHFDGQIETTIVPPPLLDEQGEEIRAELARRRVPQAASD